MKVLGVVLVVVAHVVLAQNFCDVRTGIQSMSDNVSVFTSKRTSTLRQVTFEERPHNLTQGDCSETSGFLSVNGDACTVPRPGTVVLDRTGIRFPPSEATGGRAPVIYCIQVIDLLNDGTGGFPSTESGGIGFNYVKLLVESQMGEGMKYHFAVYAKDSV